MLIANCNSSVGTEQNRFGWEKDKITEFSILDGKMEFTILYEIWTKNGQMANWSPEKAVKAFKTFQIHWRYHNVFTVGLKKPMPIIIVMRME